MPLADDIKEVVRQEYVSGQISDLTVKLPSERQLRARFKVSRPTINKALNALASEGLLVKPQGKRQYVVVKYPPANSAKSSAPFSIGFVTGDLSVLTFGSEIVYRIFEGIHSVADRKNCRVIIGKSGVDIESERAAAQGLIASGTSGLIIMPYARTLGHLDADYLKKDDLDVPIVLIDNVFPEQGHQQVIFDNKRAGHDITTHLIGKGHSRIGFLSILQERRHAPILKRLQGYQEAMIAAGHFPDPSLVQMLPIEELEEFFNSDAKIDVLLNRILDEWLTLDEPPTAIIALEDTTAMEIIDLLLKRRIRVPHQLEVVGFDNLAAGRRFKPSFTTTSPDFKRMGEIACELLLDSIASGVESYRTYVLDAPVLIRDATPFDDYLKTLSVPIPQIV